MHRIVYLGIVTAAVAVGIWLTMMQFGTAKQRGGPTLTGNLRVLEANKLAWQLDHTNEWPTAQDVFATTLRPRYGEIYIVNRTGEPSCVYFPRAAGPFHEGQLLCLRSNELVPLRSR